jgi:hypothetical protein
MGLDFKHIKGDTFEAVNFVMTTGVIPVAIDLTGAVIKMQLRKSCDIVKALSLTSVLNAGITITNASGGLFKINKQIINIDPFNYVYDIEITFSSGVVKTYISGLFNVTPDITR